MTWAWRLLEEDCTGCGICADVCLYGAIEHSSEQPYPLGIEGPCTGCMACVEECPFDAVVVT